MKKQFFYEIILPLLGLIIAGIVSLICSGIKIDWGNFTADPVFELRFIRLIGAFTVGASLALAGMVFQAVLRNQLAEPFTLGISGGAGVGAAAAIILNLPAITLLAVPLSALAGALILLIFVLAVAGKRSSENLLLSGVIAGTVASGILMYMVSIADKDELAGLAWWMLGDLQTPEKTLLLAAAAVLLILTIFFRLFARELNALTMGDEMAYSMGVNSKLFLRLFVIAASLLAAQTVALAGIIAFAGLIVPHLVRMCYGSNLHHTVLPTALWGGCFLMICDWLSRIIHPMHELPVGVMTAAVGGVLFIYILNRKRGNI